MPILAACGGACIQRNSEEGHGVLRPVGGGNLKASYQVIQWNNFYQTFSSAVASKTGPAVSTGGGFQAFQFEQQGQIAYADKVIDAMKKNGQFDDFLPGVLDPFKSDKGYVAVPWALDIRVMWHRKSLFDKAGVAPPTDWPSMLEAGRALKKIGATGFTTGAGAGNPAGNHAVIQMMVNNGGGVWAPDGRLDVMNDRNLEAVEFMYELYSNGIIDPAAVSYTTDNQDAQWKDKTKAAYGPHASGLTNREGDTSGDLMVAPVLTGPHGDKATLVFPNNIMMYKNTPSQESSEAFLLDYMGQIKQFWQQKLVNLLPVFKSISELPAFAGDPNNVKIIKEWQPIAKTFAARGTALNANMAVLDGGQALTQFSQTILSGKGDAKTALKPVVKS
ncbi:ABC transporter substrate-binding protein [bacterium RCC_150]